VNFHQHRLRGARAAVSDLTPQHATVRQDLAVIWRDEWRAEVACRGGFRFVKAKLAVSPRAVSQERDKTASFATAIARDEFGRFYWNGKLARQLAETLIGGAQKRARTSKPASGGRGQRAR
jgi:hypothetical protein